MDNDLYRLMISSYKTFLKSLELSEKADPNVLNGLQIANVLSIGLCRSVGDIMIDLIDNKEGL